MDRERKGSASTTAASSSVPVRGKSKRSSNGSSSAGPKPSSVLVRSVSVSSQSQLKSVDVKSLVEKLKSLSSDANGSRGQDSNNEQLRNCSTKLLNAVKAQRTFLWITFFFIIRLEYFEDQMCFSLISAIFPICSFFETNVERRAINQLCLRSWNFEGKIQYICQYVRSFSFVDFYPSFVPFYVACRSVLLTIWLSVLEQIEHC